MWTSGLFFVAALLMAHPLAAQARQLSALDYARIERSNEVFVTEREFDAFTHKQGYTKGFFTYSAPGAIAFDNSGAVRIHDKLADRLDAGQGNDAPSTLRWHPYEVWLGAGNLAWDIGPWQVEGSKKAGWFLTIWRKQENGSWLWVLDTSAGPLDASGAPRPDTTLDIDQGAWTGSDPNGVDQIPGLDDALNQYLAARPANLAYADHLKTVQLVVSDNDPPATEAAAIKAGLATRPGKLTWLSDGRGSSELGDTVYTYGHTAADGVYKGHFVRIWQRSSPKAPWRLVVDLYQSAK